MCVFFDLVRLTERLSSGSGRETSSPSSSAQINWSVCSRLCVCVCVCPSSLAKRAGDETIVDTCSFHTGGHKRVWRAGDRRTDTFHRISLAILFDVQYNSMIATLLSRTHPGRLPHPPFTQQVVHMDIFKIGDVVALWLWCWATKRKVASSNLTFTKLPSLGT